MFFNLLRQRMKGKLPFEWIKRNQFISLMLLDISNNLCETFFFRIIVRDRYMTVCICEIGWYKPVWRFVNRIQIHSFPMKIWTTELWQLFFSLKNWCKMIMEVLSGFFTSLLNAFYLREVQFKLLEKKYNDRNIICGSIAQLRKFSCFQKLNSIFLST